MSARIEGTNHDKASYGRSRFHIECEMKERRRGTRIRAYKGARIILNNGRSTIDCVVVDQSRSGARLRVASSRDIPDAFDLLLVFEDIIRPCRVVWRTVHALGIAFQDRPRAAGTRSEC
jgi:hypothetical protein